MNLDELLINMSIDFTRREGTEMAKRPKFDRGSSLWNQPTYLVEAYIDTLSRNNREYRKMKEKVREEVGHPEWIDVPLANQKGIKDYIDFLEHKIVEQGKVIEKYEERDRLTELWARGEIEN